MKLQNTLIILLALVSVAASTLGAALYASLKRQDLPIAAASAPASAPAPARPPVAAAPADRDRPDDAEILRRVETLAARLREDPEDLEGWKMLGRSYRVLGRLSEAVGAYSRASQLAPSDTEVRAVLLQLQDEARRAGKHED